MSSTLTSQSNLSLSLLDEKDKTGNFAILKSFTFLILSSGITICFFTVLETITQSQLAPGHPQIPTNNNFKNRSDSFKFLPQSESFVLMTNLIEEPQHAHESIKSMIPTFKLRDDTKGLHLLINMHGLGANATEKNQHYLQRVVNSDFKLDEQGPSNVDSQWLFKVIDLPYAEGPSHALYPSLETQSHKACLLINQIVAKVSISIPLSAHGRKNKEAELPIRVSIIGHSQGGMVARHLVSNCDLYRPSKIGSEFLGNNTNENEYANTLSVGKYFYNYIPFHNFVSVCAPQGGQISPARNPEGAKSWGTTVQSWLTNVYYLLIYRQLPAQQGQYEIEYDPRVKPQDEPCTFLKSLNNACDVEKTPPGKMEKQKMKMLQLKRFVMYECIRDIVVVPQQSEHFARFENVENIDANLNADPDFYSPNITSADDFEAFSTAVYDPRYVFPPRWTKVLRLLPLRAQKELWTDDRIGLRHLDDTGRLYFRKINATHDNADFHQLQKISGSAEF